MTTYAVTAATGQIGRLAIARLKEKVGADNIIALVRNPGKAYELVGDAAYTLAELAAEISKQSGKTIPYQDIPPADYAAALVQAGVPEGFAAMIAGWDADAKNGALFGDSKDLHNLLGRATTPIAESVKAALS